MMAPVYLPGPAGALRVDDGGPSTPTDPVPVIFVHSLAGNADQWSEQLARLRATRRAIAIELRGHGRSEAPRNGDYSITAMATDIAAVTDELELEQIVLVGHSLGGGVSLAYAGAHPERVAGLLLLDPIGDGKQISPEEVQPLLDGLATDYLGTIRKYWTTIAGTIETVRQRLLADLDATPRQTVIRAFPEALRFDPDPWLARYRGPILSVIAPYNDQPFSLHRLGRGFPYRMVQGTGHWIQLDKPDEFYAILDEFLNQVRSKK
jgi:pimeloyl-ACP methyl ester carboxylesterase